MDILNIISKIETLSQLKGWKFILGVSATMNLFDKVVGENDVIVMVDAYVGGRVELNELGGKDKERATLKIFILKKAKFDQLIGNENGYETSSGKWEENIIPLSGKVGELIAGLRSSCRYRIAGYEYIPVFNLFDLNTDGFSIKIDFEV